jgi:hypothetical protein
MRILALASVQAALLVAPSFATSGVPSPSNSTVPACFVGCPLGDIRTVIVVRDLASNPVNASTVVLDFSQCASVYLCPDDPQDSITVDLGTRRVSGTTNASGQVSFPLHAGGFCGSDGAKIYADGILLANRTFKSPDQNGDGVVIEPDFTTFFAKMGSGDPSADFDCSGLVDSSDQIVMNAHADHSCFGIVDPALPRSWGSLKLLYR